jgi:2'-5' RNA ligase
MAVRHSGGRPVPESNLHITLAFLGSVPEHRVEELAAIAGRTAANFPRAAVPLAVSLEGFEHWAKPQILAVLGQTEEADAAPKSGTTVLAQVLVAEAAAAGFRPDLKPFRAHVTVARKVARAARSSEMRRMLWSFDSFALIESRTLPGGPVYSVVESFVLGSAEKVGA